MTTTRVTEIPAADPATAIAHFEGLLALETDCWDVHNALEEGADFVLLDVRAPASFAAGHIDGALNWPYAKLTEKRLIDYAADTVFVVYCAGPHCNAADRAAVRLAHLGRPVKKMIGGVEGWKDEGFDIATG